ncbi:MAG: sporulation protein YtfJ [Firmicutes bacterium HGW-Firmicutes-14]|jgi:sporulation protein YtfJ|nr:MAG: sporulation protein YtfJ [Firmicutes bacterium HGW-Firmicutes-14]
MADHPIEGLMKTAMESIKEMVDVNTIVGDPVETPDGSVIIPVSRVAAGFAAGGGEFEATGGGQQEQQGQGGGQQGQQGGNGSALPFGGGSGAGVSVQPVGFLVVGQGQIRLLPVDGNAVVDRIIDVAPNLLSQMQNMFKRERKQPECH